MTCDVLLRPAAEREWRRWPPQVGPRIGQALLGLEENPRPHGVSKPSGYRDRWRLRVGDYRIIFQIDDAERQLTVLRIAHRRQAYR